MKKNFVLDTNVLLHDPNAILSFDDNDIVIPIYVIEEIDRFKKELSELGRNARVVSRLIDEFRASGQLSTGVRMPTGGILRVVQGTRAGQTGHLHHQGHQSAHQGRCLGHQGRGLRHRVRDPGRNLHRRSGAQAEQGQD
jgi:predicted ribonuclease YlaK